MSERTPLLLVPHQRFRRLKCHLTNIRSRAAVLVLLWDLGFQVYKLFAVYFIAVASGIISLHERATYLFYDFFLIAYLFYPVGGLIADVWIGRYRMIVISIYVCLVAWLLTVITYVLHHYIHDEMVSNPIIITMVTIITCLLVSSRAGFQANVLPFNIDQMMGASGDQLSAIVYWHMFGNVLYSIPFPRVESSLSKMYFIITCLIISIITIVLIIISHCLFKHWLDTTPQITNPIKLIVKVLDYARKNKYPRNRSALTYWEDDYPSRLDLGKEKYGGPFSEEEVEDVKTVLRLLPFFICVVGFPISWGAYKFPIDVSGFGDGIVSRVLQVFLEEDHIQFFVFSLLILFYQFIIHPCFYKYIPSMLKRIGLGMVFALLTSIFYFIILIVGDFSDPSLQCPSNHSNTSTVMVLNYKWLLTPHIMYGCCTFLVVVTTLEFTVAQSPRQMRGLMVGLCYATYGIGRLLNFNLVLLLVYFKSLSRGCILYYHIANLISLLFTFVLFLIFAKRYKLRVRDNIFPAHWIIEEHYERYLDQSEENRRGSGR